MIVTVTPEPLPDTHDEGDSATTSLKTSMPWNCSGSTSLSVTKRCCRRSQSLVALWRTVVATTPWQSRTPQQDRRHRRGAEPRTCGGHRHRLRRVAAEDADRWYRVEGGAGAAVLDAAGIRMAAVGTEFLITISGAVTIVAAVEATGVLAIAINNTPDPKVSQTESTNVGQSTGER
ncbi:hypothetical protein [Saccharopolyspora hattusasensis]|uniref:hypothetical protein n=1 Tax=Saccharopolyspora hattusasensis TaxID=1128679 RepID=UPI003D981EAE